MARSSFLGYNTNNLVIDKAAVNKGGQKVKQATTDDKYSTSKNKRGKCKGAKKCDDYNSSSWWWIIIVIVVIIIICFIALAVYSRHKNSNYNQS